MTACRKQVNASVFQLWLTYRQTELWHCHSWAFLEGVCVCVGEWDSCFTSNVLCECKQAHTGVSVYVCTCQLHACVPVCVYVCVCRLEELWRVGFMSQQVTDDQINWSRASASSWICSGDLDSAGASQRYHCSRTLTISPTTMMHADSALVVTTWKLMTLICGWYF